MAFFTSPFTLCSTETNFPFLKPKYVRILLIPAFPQIFQARMDSQNHFQHPDEHYIPQFSYNHYFLQQHMSRTDRSVAQKTKDVFKSRFLLSCVLRIPLSNNFPRASAIKSRLIRIVTQKNCARAIMHGWNKSFVSNFFN